MLKALRTVREMLALLVWLLGLLVWLVPYMSILAGEYIWDGFYPDDHAIDRVEAWLSRVNDAWYRFCHALAGK